MVEFINYPLVYLVWYDAVSSDSWIEVNEIPTIPPIHTVGFMVGEDDTSITLAMNADISNHHVSMTMTIPLAWIESMDYLERR